MSSAEWPRRDRRLRTIFEVNLVGLIVVDDDRRYVRLNESAGRLLGAPASEIVGRRLEDFTPPERWRELELFWRRLRRIGELNGSCDVLQPSGSVRTISYHASWDFGPGEHLIAALDSPPCRAAVPDVSAANLTPRQHEIIGLVAEGCSNREIASYLTLSPATVKTHLVNIYEKLQVRDRASAVAIALRSGIIS